MKPILLAALVVLLQVAGPVQAGDDVLVSSGSLLPDPPADAALWWAGSAAARIRPDQIPPTRTSPAVVIRSARNETDAAQVVLRPQRSLEGFVIRHGPLLGPGGERFPQDRIEVLEVAYVDVVRPTDPHSEPGRWPDPLLPVTGPLELEPDVNHAFWIRVSVPREQRAGTYRGTLELHAMDWRARVPLEITVYDFTLPDRMTCTTAFGFSAATVFRYHGLKTDEDKRRVLDLYFASMAAHHVSPYDPAPMDRIRVRWPDVRPPRSPWDRWSNVRIVDNEVHGGEGALLIYDDKTDENVTVGYEPLIEIPSGGLRVRCWYRTAVPGHRFLVSLNHYDENRRWISGHNQDVVLRGTGVWQGLDAVLTDFPRGTRYVRFHARATTWTESGEHVGLVWLDDVSITDPATGREFVEGGDFEQAKRTTPVVPPEELEVTFDFRAWDRAMARAVDEHHFNSFRLSIPGIGGGTYHAVTEPRLLGFGEDTPEYPILFDSYCRQLEAHLRGKGWLDEAFVYWFDEPGPDQYPFVRNGFAKLERSCPGIARMLTEQVEPGLLGGPDIWCPISNRYDPERAEARRRHGERFWWYVCTGPKAPHAGLFIDHPAPELRIWLWQTWKRGIEGILVWQTNYWTSDAAYPDRRYPQNPYEDPMSWTQGYDTPAGSRQPWGNGDGRLLYPPPAAASADSDVPVLEGPVDSVRWEQLRDGIEDYEYLCMLRRLLDARGDAVGAEERERYARLLEVPESITRSLTAFARDGEAIEMRRDEIARAIERLK